MAEKRSREALFGFMDYMANKGLMAKATVSARKASAGKVLGILSEDEAADVTNIDLDDVMARFQILEGQKYTPASLNVYLSRTRSALEDFESYLTNPMGFRPSVQRRDRKGKPAESPSSNNSEKPSRHSQTAPTVSASYLPPSSSILPIPIRPDVVVHIQGLPYDLTEVEANKIANVVRAMAMAA